MMNKILIMIFLLMPCCLLAEETTHTSTTPESNAIQIEKESETIDFKTIKGVLKNDMLDNVVTKKIEQVKEIKKQKQIEKVNEYKIPGKDEFWQFFSEYWLVKNAVVLKWDFEKPDYGIDEAFAGFLEKMGHFEKTFKIILINGPVVFHFGLPSGANEMIFILSVPFIRTLDLSKLEISLLLFEDYLRLRQEYLIKAVSTKEITDLIGGNFSEKKIDKKIFENLLKKFDEFIYDGGFNFEQQFEITKQMGDLLKSDLNLWNSYLNLLKKMDDLIKNNVLYSKYNKIYPSPELQLNWLRPKEKSL